MHARLAKYIVKKVKFMLRHLSLVLLYSSLWEATGSWSSHIFLLRTCSLRKML